MSCSLKSKIIQKSYTFDDLLLLPRYSDILPSMVDISTYLTPSIKLSIPIISSAMDTVTESKMAIALAKEGGLGFIHKNMSIEKQAEMVLKVKRNQGGFISDPITLFPDSTLYRAKEVLENYEISGIPIVDNNRKLVGIITSRDLKFIVNNLDGKVCEVMTTTNLITASLGTSTEDAKVILGKNKIEKLPIIDESNCLVGLITLNDIESFEKNPHASRDSNSRLRVGVAVGVSIDTLDRVKKLYEKNVDVVAIDSAHGHSKGVIDTIKEIKSAFPDLEVIGGNVVTPEGAKALINAGCSAIKVGIGPGSICTTRVVAGVGISQLSAIANVYAIAKEHGICVIADGGIKNSGDIPKAIAAGADSVMLGSLLAGCSESPGEEIVYNGRRFKVYQGMGSLSAMQRGSKDRYFQDKQSEVKKLVPEGIEGRLPYKGKVADTLYQLVGGLRAGMGYCGCKNINELKNDAQFVEITQSGLIESHPHDVEITVQSPNYYGK